VANPVIINGDTSTPAARAGGLGFYWKQLTGNNSAGPLWSNDSIASGGVTISGNTWTPPNSVTPLHDDDGNLTYDGRWDSVWDAENRLTCMTTTEAAATAGVPRQRLDFVYDCQNRRVSKTVSTSTDGTTWTVSSSLRFLYDGWNMIAEYSATSETSTTLTLQAAHVWGIDLSGTPQGAGGVGGLLCSTLVNDISTSNNYYPAYDGNGNISAWLDSTGTLLTRMDYSPFGQLVAQYKYTSTASATLSRLPFGFSTKYTDKETGLLYYGHRYYDSVTGRWPSRDTIGEEGGINLYGFEGNDGVDWIDPTGLAPMNSATQFLFKQRAGELLQKEGVPEPEIRLRLLIIQNVFDGKVGGIGEVRNPDFWIDQDNKFVVKPGKLATDAITDMWSYKLGQTFCLKYSALIMQKAYIDFAKQAQQAGNPRGQKGLDAMNKVIPEGLLAGTGGKGVFYDETEENGPTSYSRPLLPGDQLQFDNPYYHDMPAHGNNKNPASGEEGSNVFYVGDGIVIELYRRESHTIGNYQKHFLDWNTVRDWASIWPPIQHRPRPEDFNIIKVRRPRNPVAVFEKITERGESK